jgi:hypothetical protein
VTMKYRAHSPKRMLAQHAISLRRYVSTVECKIGSPQFSVVMATRQISKVDSHLSHDSLWRPSLPLAKVVDSQTIKYSFQGVQSDVGMYAAAGLDAERHRIKSLT